MGIGGFNEKVLNTAELFSTVTNEWSPLPRLNKARQSPGSCLLKSMKAFCFCGFNEFSNINSIEIFSIGNDDKWSLLPIDSRVAATQQLVAVSYEESIIVFGGTQLSTYCMYLFSQNGEFLCDMSSLPDIPGFMCQGVTVASEGKIYAFG